MMKKTYLFLLGLITLFPSCHFLDKELDTELTLDLVFEDKTRTYGWLANVYSAIPDPYFGYGRYLGWDILGDEMSPSERWRQWDWKVIPYIVGEWTPSSSWDGNYWAMLPQRIREAEIFKQNVHPLPDQGIGAKEVEYMKAECDALIAYYYWLMVNTYGAIPFTPGKVYTTDATEEEMMQGQAPYYTVIDWCDSVLLDVSHRLPTTYSSQKYGRFTAVMALAVRARMLLYAASPLVNGNPDYAGYTNCHNVPVFSTEQDPSRWTKAADACKLLIETAEAAGHTLYIERTQQGQIDAFMSVQNVLFTRYDEGNTEILFARPNGCNYTDLEKHSTPANSGGNGGYGITQSLVDAFFMENGLPITDEASGYVEEGFNEAAVSSEKTEWGSKVNGGYITYPHTYNMYCHREPRFYVAVNYHNAWFTQENRTFNFFNGAQDNTHTHDAPQSGYLVRKKIHPNTNVKENNFPYRPGILYRLGEAYLNYAEALNETDKRDVHEILYYINLIRQRAGVRTYTTGATNADEIHVETDREQLREIIRMERHVELCCEGLRYDDLRRWKLAENLLDGPQYGMNFSGKDDASFFQRVIYQQRVYRKAYYWFPIHQTEIDKNKYLKQLPYWN